MTKVGFTYDPLNLMRIAINLYMENKYNANEAYSQSVRFAVFEFLNTMTNDELEALLQEYVDTENVEAITIEQHDRERLEHYILKSDRYLALLFDKQLKGIDGLGVADLVNRTFTPCNYAHHWETLRGILIKDHGAYGEAFDQIRYGNRDEYAGVTESMLNTFIMEQFKFVGSERRLERT